MSDFPESQFRSMSQPTNNAIMGDRITLMTNQTVPGIKIVAK